MKRISHWIGGRVVPGTSGREGPIFNPALGEQTAVVDLASAAEVDAAVTSAKEAYPGWRTTSLAKRAEVLFNLHELVDGNRKEIAALITSEHGKVLSDAEGEVARGLETWSSPAACPTCSRVGTPSRSRPASTSTRSFSPLAW